LESWPVKMGPTRCPETSVNNYHTTPCNYPKDHRLHQHRGGSLKSRLAYKSLWVSQEHNLRLSMFVTRNVCLHIKKGTRGEARRHSEGRRDMGRYWRGGALGILRYGEVWLLDDPHVNLPISYVVKCAPYMFSTDYTIYVVYAGTPGIQRHRLQTVLDARFSEQGMLRLWREVHNVQASSSLSCVWADLLLKVLQPRDSRQDHGVYRYTQKARRFLCYILL
jgi:hypothetical protein